MSMAYEFAKERYKALGIELPYDGDFDDFMNDSASVLVFK